MLIQMLVQLLIMGMLWKLLIQMMLFQLLLHQLDQPPYMDGSSEPTGSTASDLMELLVLMMALLLLRG